MKQYTITGLLMVFLACSGTSAFAHSDQFHSGNDGIPGRGLLVVRTLTDHQPASLQLVRGFSFKRHHGHSFKRRPFHGNPHFRKPFFGHHFNRGRRDGFVFQFNFGPSFGRFHSPHAFDAIRNPHAFMFREFNNPHYFSNRNFFFNDRRFTFGHRFERRFGFDHDRGFSRFGANHRLNPGLMRFKGLR